MSAGMQAALLAGAFLAAFAAAAVGAVQVMEGRDQALYRASRMRAAGSLLPLDDAGALERMVLVFAARQVAGATLQRQVASEPGRPAASDGWRGLLRHAGLEEHLSAAGLQSARVRLGCMGAAGGAVLGAMLSLELSLLLGVLGIVAGLAAPTWALRRVAAQRLLALERSLPEMLEVVALGLRSGLSFDRSLQLYSEHFPSAFARACASVQKSWLLGLRTRDEALRDLAASYGSDQLERTVERIIRSLRFGSALAPDLEAAAADARARRRAQVEERVAKAPVKMMIPTGALILPAMLILVLGPVLLEFVRG